ncbi:Zinc metalloprotease [hydrothermal vent metagenome]|uniref:Zinc metalloprotease n=1 Tax=hydrothermal vent metagenome TaxID=652676 RepID=A0A1W1BH97_9ZZZZ
MHTFKNNKFRDYSVNVICNPRLKNSYIRVDHDNTITVKTPYESKRFINTLLDKKQDWIEKKIQQNALREPLQVNLEDEVLFFGEIISINSEEATLLRKKLHKMKAATPQNIQKAYDYFYKETARNYLTKEIKKYAAIMQLEFSALRFRKMRSRWGSCSSKRIITLNSELMKLDKELICYVVIHELAHLVHMNHSKDFHNLVEQYLPNSKQIRKRLKTMII